MDKLTMTYGLKYEVMIEAWGKYYGDYSDIQLYPNKGGKQIWVYYHNYAGSTYAK